MVAFELRCALHNARHQALTDTLTGVGNRHAFFENGERLFSGRPVPPHNALLYVDLDGFKQLNDGHGHHAGDTALCIVAECVRRNVRGRDFAARIGGDEFAARFSDCDDPELVGERIRQEVRDELRLRGWAVTASVGVLDLQQPTFQVLPGAGRGRCPHVSSETGWQRPHRQRRIQELGSRSGAPVIARPGSGHHVLEASGTISAPQTARPFSQQARLA